MDLGIFDEGVIISIVNLILMVLLLVIGLLYNLEVTLRHAPRWKLVTITIIVLAIIILGLLLARTDGNVGDLMSSILGHYIITALIIWFLAYIVWIGKPHRRTKNLKQN